MASASPSTPHIASRPAPRLDVGTALFYALLIATAAVVIVLPLSESGRQTLVQAHHLRSPEFARWAALQFVPSMYSYGHQVWISEQPLTPQQRQSAEPLPTGATTQWVNHYPTRMMTFGAQRAALAHHPRTMHLYLHSQFGPTQVRSHYCIEPKNGQVEMRLLDDEPASGGHSE